MSPQTCPAIVHPLPPTGKTDAAGASWQSASNARLTKVFLYKYIQSYFVFFAKIQIILTKTNFQASFRHIFVLVAPLIDDHYKST
jgi:hypothetical protein